MSGLVEKGGTLADAWKNYWREWGQYSALIKDGKLS